MATDEPRGSDILWGEVQEHRALTFQKALNTEMWRDERAESISIELSARLIYC